MMKADDIRLVRVKRRESQEKFGSHFGVSRFHVMLWERYGIADAPLIERRLQELEGLDGQRDMDGRR